MMKFIKHLTVASVFVLITLPLTIRGQSAAPTPRASSPTVTALVNVNVIPMDRERILKGQTVVIKGNKIIKIGPYKTTKPPKNALQIDGRGKYLIPGLSDLHIHLRSTDELVSYLAYGVTTVLHMSGAESGAPDLLRYRKDLASGEMLGPTLYLTGPLIDGPRPIFPKLAVATKSPDDARRIVTEHKQIGYDFLKTYNFLARDVYVALSEEARKQGIAVIGHIPQAMEIEEALSAGHAMVAHVSFYPPGSFENGKFRLDEKKIPERVAATVKAGAFVTPTLVTLDTAVRGIKNFDELFVDPELKYLHPDTIQMWRQNNPHKLPNYGQFTVLETYPSDRRLTKALSDGGVPLLLGTDAAVAGVFPGKSAHQELKLLVEVGLTPFQALSTGTRKAGQFINRYVPSSERFGVVAVGWRADLLLLGANPLDDINNTSNVLGVMSRGKWFTKADLEKRRNDMADKYNSAK